MVFLLFKFVVYSLNLCTRLCLKIFFHIAEQGRLCERTEKRGFKRGEDEDRKKKNKKEGMFGISDIK